MGWIKDIFGVFQPQRITNEPAPPVPAGMERIHLFVGNFDDDIAAYHYCCGDGEVDVPEPINLDLQDTSVDTQFLEFFFGSARYSVLDVLFEGVALNKYRAAVDGYNTLVIISERAFGGLNYHLTDTPKLDYRGPIEVDAERFNRAIDTDFHNLT